MKHAHMTDLLFGSPNEDMGPEFSEPKPTVKVTGVNNFLQRWCAERKVRRALKDLLRTCGGTKGVEKAFRIYAENSGFVRTVDGNQEIFTKGDSKITIISDGKQDISVEAQKI
jgi:hypothetical protein